MLNPFKTLYLSLTNPSVYPTLAKYPLRTVFSYNLICYIGFSLIIALFLMVAFYPKLSFEIKDAVLIANHPNLNEPINLPVPNLTPDELNLFLDTLKNAPPAIITLSLTLGLLIGVYPTRLLYALVIAAIFTLISKLNRQPHKLKAYFNLNLACLCGAEAINVLTIILYGRLTPIIFTLAFFGYSFVALYTITKEQKNTLQP